MTVRPSARTTAQRTLAALRPNVDSLRTYTVIGLLDLDEESLQSELLIAGVIEGSVVTIDAEPLSGRDGRFQRFCHQVRAASIEAAETECRAYVAHVDSLIIEAHDLRVSRNAP